jgi:hypothetical protein
MSSLRQKIVAWSLAIVGVLIFVFCQKIVFPSLVRLVSTETIVGRENVIYQPDGSSVFTNPGAIVRRISRDKAGTFSSLPKDDELQLTFTTHGCFHYGRYELTFHRSIDTTVSIVHIEVEWSPKLEQFTPIDRVPLGELTLTKTDVSGLDHLIEFYRSGPGKGCTTVDEISVVQRHEGEVTSRERFTDGSCSYDKKDLTRITELVARLAKK